MRQLNTPSYLSRGRGSSIILSVESSSRPIQYFTMLVLPIFATLLATLALPAYGTPTGEIAARQQVQGKFCEKVFPAPSDDVIKARHDKFVDAFLVKKDIVETFSYIAPEYIVGHSTNYSM